MAGFQDAFGHAIYDYFNGVEGACSIIERDDGLVDVDNLTMYFAENRDWSLHQREAMGYVRGRVLDVGCGAGRHCLYLQEQGFDALGIDRSPLAVEVCKLRGFDNARVIPIAQVDHEMGAFDTILMLGNNFGLFGSFDGARELLARFHSTTSEKARIIAETRDPYKTTDPVHLEYHELNRQRGRMPGQVRLRIRYRKLANPWFDYLFVSKEEMEQILEGTGWEARRFLDAGDLYIAIIEKT
jgi:SAM-dependent methyltransferase